LQVKLLRAIELKEVTPVGTSLPIAVDVRIIASTNKNLTKEVEAGRYREDLFYRLNIVEILLPSLTSAWTTYRSWCSTSSASMPRR